MMTDGVIVVDGDSFTQTGFIPTGVGTHGLYPSRDGTKLYVINRGSHTIPGAAHTGRARSPCSISRPTKSWPRGRCPDGGSPDMGNLTPDGKELWLGGRYDSEVYVFDTTNGQLAARIPVGQRSPRADGVAPARSLQPRPHRQHALGQAASAGRRVRPDSPSCSTTPQSQAPVRASPRRGGRRRR